MGPVVCLKVFMNHFQHPFWEIIFIDYTRELQIMAQSLVLPHTQRPNPFSIYASFMSFDQWDANSNGGNSHLVQA